MDTVLIVDDDPALRELFSIFLEMGGYRTQAASGGTECIELLKTQQPDLILLDLMMEPLDGWETLSAIRNYPPSSHIPVIIITGKQPIPEEIYQYGGLIEDFIVKPVDFKLIAESFHRIIEKTRNLGREIERIGNEVQEPELLNEYACLLRLIRVVFNLEKRCGDPSWTESIPFTEHEKRLQLLHKKLNCPDRLLELDGWGCFCLKG
jgi:CheY-like chemotaxis protein